MGRYLFYYKLAKYIFATLQKNCKEFNVILDKCQLVLGLELLSLFVIGEF